MLQKAGKLDTVTQFLVTQFHKSTLQEKTCNKSHTGRDPQISHSVIDTSCKYLQPRSKEQDTVVLTSLSFRVFLT